MNNKNFLRPLGQHTIHTPTPFINSSTVPTNRLSTRLEVNQYNQQWPKDQTYKHSVFERPQQGIIKVTSSSPKSYQKTDGIFSIPVKKKDKDPIIPEYSGASIVSSHQPIKTGITSSTGSKKGMLSSLWSTNSERKSYQIKKGSHLKSQYNLENIRDDPIFHEFEIIKQIGQGKFSKFCIARHIPTGMIFGLKTIKKKTVSEQNLITQLLRQIKILSFVSHPNIVSLLKVFSYGDNIYLVQQLGCDGQLYSRMTKHKFSQQGTSFVMRGLLAAVSYLHNHNIIHRDIKPQNVVVVHGIVKLCDLGWSVHTKSKFRETICGTPLYASPELLQGSKYNQKIDLWALGIMAYELRFGQTPFDVKTKNQLHKVITDEIDFSKQQVSQQFQHFVKSLLQKNPRQRLTAQMMLKHPFILKYKQFQTCEQLCTKLN